MQKEITQNPIREPWVLERGKQKDEDKITASQSGVMIHVYNSKTSREVGESELTLGYLVSSPVSKTAKQC